MIHPCPHADEHPMMLSCPCGYLSRSVRELLAEELRSIAKTVNTAVFPDEQAPGMRRALVRLLVARVDELANEESETRPETAGKKPSEGAGRVGRHPMRSHRFAGPTPSEAVRELRMAADRFAAEESPLLDRAADKLRARADELDPS